MGNHMYSHSSFRLMPYARSFFGLRKHDRPVEPAPAADSRESRQKCRIQPQQAKCFTYATVCVIWFSADSRNKGRLRYTSLG